MIKVKNSTTRILLSAKQFHIMHHLCSQKAQCSNDQLIWWLLLTVTMLVHLLLDLDSHNISECPIQVKLKAIYNPKSNISLTKWMRQWRKPQLIQCLSRLISVKTKIWLMVECTSHQDVLMKLQAVTQGNKVFPLLSLMLVKSQFQFTTLKCLKLSHSTTHIYQMLSLQPQPNWWMKQERISCRRDRQTQQV
jgi:hypothetical protein